MNNFIDAITAAQRTANLQRCDYVVMYDVTDGYTVIPASGLARFLEANPTDSFVATVSPIQEVA